MTSSYSMRIMVRVLFVLTVWLTLTLTNDVPALQEETVSRGTTDYLNGLDLLDGADWNGATASFSKAIGANDEQPDCYLARGVAQTLAEKLTDAQRDLERANRLRPNHDPTRLWLASVIAMQGKMSEDTLILPAATRGPLRDRRSRNVAPIWQSGVSQTAESTIALRDNNPESARTALEKAVQADLNCQEAWRRLVQVYGQLKLSDEMYQAQFDSANKLHTTAGPMLKLAWLKMNRTAWTSAKSALELAATADPVDPRIAAYRGLIELARDRPNESAAWFLTATALCQAHLKLGGIDLLGKDPVPQSANDIAMLMQVSRLSGDMLLRTSRPAIVIELLEPRLELARRLFMNSDGLAICRLRSCRNCKTFRKHCRIDRNVDRRQQ